MKFVVVDVGCIECGIDTRLAGVYDTREEAENMVEFLEEKYHNYPEIFEVPKWGDLINREVIIDGGVIEPGKELTP